MDGDRAVRLQRPVQPACATSTRCRGRCQQPHPPIWIPGGGSVETWDFCAENDYVYGALIVLRLPDGQGDRRRLLAPGRGARQGRQPATGWPFLQFIGVADTDAEAYRLYKEPAEYFFNRSLHVYPGFADPPGYVTEASVRARYKSQVRAVAREPSRPSTT